MAQNTAGHHLDTGDGPIQLDPVPTYAAVEAAERAAYKDFVVHSRGCMDCAHRLYACPEGKRLWAAYKQAGIIGLCGRCGLGLRHGDARAIDIEHATSASPAILLHADLADCGPVARVRRHP